MEWLERAADAHDPGLPYLNVAGIWDAVRGTDRAQNVLRRMNLVK
jgi:hypothetical protein